MPSPFVDCQCFQFFLGKGLFIFFPSSSAFLHLLFPDINHSLECPILPPSHTLYHCSFILPSLSLAPLLPCIHIPDLLFCIHKSVFLSSRTIRRIFPIPPGIHPSNLLSDRIFQALISPNDDDDPSDDFRLNETKGAFGFARECKRASFPRNTFFPDAGICP